MEIGGPDFDGIAGYVCKKFQIASRTSGVEVALSSPAVVVLINGGVPPVSVMVRFTRVNTGGTALMVVSKAGFIMALPRVNQKSYMVLSSFSE
jgi:hypothetical protein